MSNFISQFNIMRKYIQRFIKRLKLRFYLKFINTDIAPRHEEEITPYEKVCFKICLKLINHSDSEFMIAPVSNKKYIKNDTLKIFLSFIDNKVELTNHVYHYEVRLSQRDWVRLNYIYDRETEKRRVNMETQVNSQIKTSLYDVLRNISNL